MPERRVVSADGTELAARCSGSGSPLVLVHGAMSDLNAFAGIEAPLAERHSVWVYSRRGRGGSADGPDYGLEREVEDVLAVLEAAGGGGHLFGHSAGAVYALLAAPRARSLRSLSLYEPPVHVGQADPAAFEPLLAALDADAPDRALEAFFPVADIAPDEVEIVRSVEPLWQALCEGVRVFPRELRALREEGPGRLEQLPRIRVPMLYLHGELTRAPVYPSLAEVAQRWPQAARHELKGQRHLAPVFDPAGFAEALRSFTAAHDG
jgi:pimeloyl-ACP methyl ester carboxylesterase